MGKTRKDGPWISLDPIDDGVGDGASQRGILRDEEDDLGRHGANLAVYTDDGILQTNTVTVTVENDTNRSQDKVKARLGID